MLSQIISHTPTWVFGLFFGLLLLGLVQTKQRTVKRYTIYILPLAMFIFSGIGIASAFGFSGVTIVSWLLGITLLLVVGLKVKWGQTVIREADRLTIAGSWQPLILMMAIFFTKYCVTVMLAREVNFIGDIAFVATVSLLYGCFNGVFIARCVVMRQVKA